MEICFNQLLCAFSNALSYVEKDYLLTTTFHGKKIAYFCYLIGQYYQLNDKDLNDFIGCAILHDNGLTEYYKYGESVKDNDFLKIHCLVGEDNIKLLPFYDNIKNVIKYHHENAEGSGPFQLTFQDTPLLSQIIHICDWADIEYYLENMSLAQYNQMIKEMKELKDIQFTGEMLDVFEKVITYDVIKNYPEKINTFLQEGSHILYHELSNSEMLSICHLFARVIDGKSHHTSSHSIGVASKATRMGIYYHFDEDTLSKLFFAGAMHDVGKLIISRDILEKPERLTNQEYAYIQTHAYYTYTILKEMALGEIVNWASYHHEKLDGSGYPFGKKANELDFNSRLMACCDIYQALTESRPYKEPISHEDTITIMRKMAQENKIDKQIVEDMDEIFKD
ncbi:MAG: HD domain-containing protein [Coprobacillus sp.]